MATITGRLIRKGAKSDGIDGVEVILVNVATGVETKTRTPTPAGGKSGIFRFDGVVDGNYRLKSPSVIESKDLKPARIIKPLQLAEPLFADVDIQVPDNDAVHVIVYVDRAGVISGVVAPSLEEIPVTLLNLDTGEKREVTTDAQGHYSFDDQSPGRYHLTLKTFLEKRGLRLTTALPSAFTLGASGTREFDFTYEAILGTVHGYLFLDSDGTGRRTQNNPGLINVPVELTSADGKIKKTENTLKSGDVYFEVPAGKYTVEFRQVVPESTNAVPGIRGDFELVSNGTQTIEVTEGKTGDLEPVAYRLEPHEIVGKVLFTGNPARPVEGLRVVLTDDKGNEVAVDVTDKDGRYRFENVEGKHHLTFPDHPFGTQLLTRGTVDADVHSIFVAPDTFYRGETTISTSSGTSSIPAAGSLNDAVLDIASYMPTASEVGGGTPSSANRAGLPPDLQQIFDGALIQVLGRKAANVDADGFVASLNRSFALTMVEGKKTIKWTQRAYAVETELGAALSGAQASLYHLAKTALEDALPLLGGLYALKPDFDKQRTEALRSIARTEFTELVSELGAEGGPTTQRVDDLFVSLNLALANMEAEFGFDSDQVNDVHEEQNLTSFFVIRHYVDGLLANWDKTVKPSLPTFLGTKLVLLSRALSSVVESVDETTEAMDAVMLGAAERQTVRIEFSDTVELTGGRIVPILPDAVGRAQPVPPMLVGELMNWIVRFARDEGPSLIRDGGRLGVGAVRPTADRLQRLVLGAQQTSRVPHIGFTRNRVRRALGELAIQLENVSRHAADLEAVRKTNLQSRVQ